jgi:hypothetical protein
MLVTEVSRQPKDVPARLADHDPGGRIMIVWMDQAGSQHAATITPEAEARLIVAATALTSEEPGDLVASIREHFRALGFSSSCRIERAQPSGQPHLAHDHLKR